MRLQVDIPETMAATLRNSDTLSFYLSAYPGKRMTGVIARKSMNISVQYRSERVELDVYNLDGALAPGMYADVLFDSKGIPGALSVPNRPSLLRRKENMWWSSKRAKPSRWTS